MRANDFLPWERVIVASEKNQLAGFCTFCQKDELSEEYQYTPFIGFIFVDEKSRGKRLSQKMISAACLPDSDFAEIWQNISYEGKAFTEDTPTLLTSRDEKVRSKSEIIIADALNRLGIPYRYEYPLEITNEKGIRKTFYPDFICLNLRTR